MHDGGTTQNPTDEEVCSGQTSHAEVLLVVFYSKVIGLNC
jgi:peptide methionine sulfoxide reductase MsrA